MEQNKKTPEYWDNLGYSYLETGDPDKAIPCFRQAVELDNNLALYWDDLGYSYMKASDPDKAIPCFKRAVELDDNVASYWDDLGSSYAKSGTLGMAISCFKHAIELDDKNASYWDHLGISYIDNKEVDETLAIACLKQAVELYEGKASYWDNLGVAYYNSKDYAQAIECYTKAISLDENVARFWDHMGMSHNNWGAYAQAIECYNRAIELDKSEAKFWDHLGTAYNNIGKHFQAIESCKQAIELDGSIASYWAHLGNALYDSNNFIEAEKYLLKATQIDWDCSRAWKGLGETNLKIGTREKAIQCFYRALAFEKEMDSIFSIIEELNKITFAPFLFCRILQALPPFFFYSLWRELLGNSIEQSKAIRLFIDNLNENDSRTNTTRALVNYFMGDPIEAYRIFDTEIDSDENAMMDVLSQYYFVLSAKAFLEPYESILNFAKEGAKKLMNEHDETIPTSELYYIGMLYLEAGDTSEALALFRKSEAFLPSLYMLAYLYHSTKQKEEMERCVLSILEEEQKLLPFKKGFLLNFGLTKVSFDPNDYWEKLLHYAHYREVQKVHTVITEYIHEHPQRGFNWKRFSSNPYKIVDVWKLLDSCIEKGNARKIQLQANDEQKITQKISVTFGTHVTEWKAIESPDLLIQKLGEYILEQHTFLEEKKNMNDFQLLLFLLYYEGQINPEDRILLLAYLSYIDYTHKIESKKSSGAVPVKNILIPMGIEPVLPFLLNGGLNINDLFGTLLSVSVNIVIQYLIRYFNSLSGSSNKIPFAEFRKNFFSFVMQLDNHAGRKMTKEYLLMEEYITKTVL